jgi:CDP-glucose 4,6-dehydratase
VRAARDGRAAPIRNPGAIRPWQHVLEPLSGYLELGRRLLAGHQDAATAWNFGPRLDMMLTVAQIAQALAQCWPAIAIEPDARPHPHEAAVLTLDWSRARDALGWRPVWGAAPTLERTAAWYRRHHELGQVGTADDLGAYVLQAAAAGLAWAQA